MLRLAPVLTFMLAVRLQNRGTVLKNPVCVECKNENDPVTLQNGVWVPDRNGIAMPVHNACAARWAIRSAESTA